MSQFDLKAHLEKVRELFDSMEAAYDECAQRHSFTCEGCTDNCCTQLFQHHTLVEYYFLKKGVDEAPAELRQKIFNRAHAVVNYYRSVASGSRKNDSPPICPVNFDGLCVLYAHRPMICRMHGVPHEFHRPDGRKIEGGGCSRFDDRGVEVIAVDRTPFYMRLAELEKELRMVLGIDGRFSKTTAEMLLDIEAGLGKDL